MNLTIFPYEAHAGLGVVFPAKTFVLESDTDVYLISPNITSQELLTFLNKNTKNLHFIAPKNFHNMHLRSLSKLYVGDFYVQKRAAIKS